MELEKLIASSYGVEDLIFAGHSLDIERASKSIVVANEEEIGMEEFLKKHREFLESKGCCLDHIEGQLKRVQRIDLYFKFD
ncbi:MULTISPECIES: hypothetical protein [Tenacibaculum]|uniref:Uncharacterized protein n=1 Tax=Tenacibaculum larymnensis TaxID=2878201 RepID=A0A9X4EKB5_9FLAO|nr:hypothetical protein [Tenacibaculum larymnensis]MDE1205504.1 hypothetical protein [Tenacibaculum larymnensis]